MLFLQKLSPLGKVIFISAVILDVVVLVLLSLKFPQEQFVMKFGVFAAIWVIGRLIAVQVSRGK